MESLVEKIKAWGWVIMTIFTVSCFVQTLIQLSPRVTELEHRAAITEGKVSMIEVKLDTVLHQTTETKKDVKDIYRILIEESKK